MNCKQTGESICISGEFSDEEWRLLEDYLRYAEDLFACRLLNNEANCSLNIKWDRDSGGTVTSQVPLWDDVRVFLHTARPLLLHKEPTSFYHVNNLLAKSLDHPHFRAMLGYHRRTYSGKRMQSAWSIRINDLVINSEQALSTWLNAYEYHRDKEKQEVIRDLEQMLPLPALQVIFIQLLLEKTEAIFETARLVRLVLGKQSEMEFRFPQ
ncbi:MAG: hypothetical protein PHQ43_05980 [Dehalococcoidales bacterium]|nr:hypothetical protein [Dehalococcoidales bacterium]